MQKCPRLNWLVSECSWPTATCIIFSTSRLHFCKSPWHQQRATYIRVRRDRQVWIVCIGPASQRVARDADRENQEQVKRFAGSPYLDWDNWYVRRNSRLSQPSHLRHTQDPLAEPQRVERYLKDQCLEMSRIIAIHNVATHAALR
jgi:hypothetical protein